MTRARLLIVLALAVVTLLLVTTPAPADPVQGIYDTFFGCEGKFQWPCPGPAVW